MIGVLFLIVALFGAFYENRQSVYEASLNGSLILNKRSEKHALDVIRSSNHVIGIAVSAFHFERNTRELKFFVTDDEALNATFRQFLNSQISKELPLFTEDPKNNKFLIELFAGETLCRPYHESLTAKYAPDLKIATVCSQSIPPAYGKFKGCLLMYLDIELTPDTFVQVRSIAKSLALKLDNPAVLGG